MRDHQGNGYRRWRAPPSPLPPTLILSYGSPTRPLLVFQGVVSGEDAVRLFSSSGAKPGLVLFFNLNPESEVRGGGETQ